MTKLRAQANKMAASDLQIAELQVRLEQQEQLPADWQRQVLERLIRTGREHAGAGTALELLEQAGADALAEELFRNTVRTPEPRPTAGELSARRAASCGCTGVVELLAVHGGGWQRTASTR